MDLVSNDPKQDGVTGGENSVTGWQEAVNREIDKLGWADVTRMEATESGVALYVVDVFPEEDKHFTPEGPATFSLSVFLNGHGTLSVDGAEPFTFQPGSAVLFTCNRMTRGSNTFRGGGRITVIDMRLDRELLELLGGVSLAKLGGEVMTEHSLPEQDIFLIGMQASPGLLQTAQDILKCELADGLARRLFLHSKVIEAISLAIGILHEGGAHQRQIRSLNREEQTRLEKAVHLIETSYSENWTIARLAREVGLNERRLKEAFRLAIGSSVRAYLRSVRLDAAASLLHEGHSVTETAFAVGFDNLSHFSKIFREHKGVSPSRYIDSRPGLL
ncbi:AraC family transcriptional regulator [uncultured Roseibium sp.]|uniref:AraC family transcriptional regulator n=1 Tax=uncultured Roseibium sp. TaxID=1936171 RepID=UPI003216CD1C